MYQQQPARRRPEATGRLGQKQHHILALVGQGPFDQINRETPSLARATTVFSKSCAWAGPCTLASVIGRTLNRRLASRTAAACARDVLRN
jgi:hypothetical protein